MDRVSPDLRALAARMAALRDEDARGNLAMREIAAGRGVWITPTISRMGDAPGTHMHEITLAGLTATGTTGAEAMAAWQRAARRMIEAEDHVDAACRAAARDGARDDDDTDEALGDWL